MTKQTAERSALIAAGAVIVALTAGAFWLSYAHLAEIAGQHGLHGSPVRRWAWPATLDAFIIAGELLMLRAGLRRVTDGWAIALTATGAVGSIALNVAGVSGTRPADTVPLLDYVVAAVPPTAALLAFGVLMRQIHQLVDRPDNQPEPLPVRTPEPSGATAQPRGSKAVASFSPVAESPPATQSPAAAEPQSPEPSTGVPKSKSLGGRPSGATVQELAEIGRAVFAEKGKLTRAMLREAVEDRDLTISGERQTKVMHMLRPELEAAADNGPAGS